MPPELALMPLFGVFTVMLPTVAWEPTTVVAQMPLPGTCAGMPINCCVTGSSFSALRLT